jgi:hypothetical protein
MEQLMAEAVGLPAAHAAFRELGAQRGRVPGGDEPGRVSDGDGPVLDEDALGPDARTMLALARKLLRSVFSDEGEIDRWICELVAGRFEFDV